MAVAQTHATGPLSLISCVSVRESSPVDDAVVKTETKKKRFHPFRNLRRMFRRKSRQVDLDEGECTLDVDIEVTPRVLDARSNSASRLLDDDTSSTRRRSASLAPGLSLSHDSVFTPDRADSGHSSSDLENSSLSIPILIPAAARFQAELAGAVRRRHRDDSDDDFEDDEDLGLPRSPCSSLTTADLREEKPHRERPVKPNSSCSEGSLLSTGSSLEDDCPDQSGSELNLNVTRHKLSHSAAKHKMAVRPKRNHGAPAGRRRLNKSGSLPATPEVNEDPHPTSYHDSVDSALSPSPPLSLTVLDDKMKSASLPHGMISSTTKVVRSRSTATALKPNLKEPEDSETFFTRLLTRRSGKKKKEENVEKDVEEGRSSGEEEEEEEDATQPPRKLPYTKTHSRRQRVEPETLQEDQPSDWLPSKVATTPKAVWPEPAVVKEEEKEVAVIKDVKEKVRPKAPLVSIQPYSLAHEKPPPDPEREPKSPEREPKSPERIYIKNETKPRNQKPPVQKSHSFHKDSPAKPDDTKRLYQKNLKKIGKEDKNHINMKLTQRSSSLESVEDRKKPFDRTLSTDSVRSIMITHEEPKYANLKTVFSEKFDQVHHGYENIEIIELVKKEEEEKKNRPSISEKEEDDKKNRPKVPERPLKTVDEPKAIEILKVPLKEPSLIERRKSELFFDEKEKTPLRKQTSLSEKKTLVQKTAENVVIVEKEKEVKEEETVVLRRKSSSKEDEPELMKVFARRSLKVKDDDEGIRRDSDKENEIIDEEPKKEKVIDTKPKPAIPARNSIVQKYTRSLSETSTCNNKTLTLEESSPKSITEIKNKLNGIHSERSFDLTSVKLKRTSDVCLKEKEIKEIEKDKDEKKDEAEETGFKRIQDRKAEWERRLQMAKQ